jgi:hypothetical protein
MRAGVVADATTASLAVVTGGAICLLGLAAVAATNAPLRRFDVRRAEDARPDTEVPEEPHGGPW